jgi:succinate-semialdehyde dehydrogenase/glutarate-semialdehyde dehydrogenase
MPLATINPATGRPVQVFPELTEAEISGKLDVARAAFRVHRRSTFPERAGKLLELGKILEGEQEILARLAALEMGKPLAQGRAEAVKCAQACRFYAENGEAMLRDERIDARSWVRLEPRGVVLALMPWNFPFWQVIRCAVPALTAGNVVVLKHADNTPQCGAAMEDVFRRAGFAPGCFQYLAVPVAGVKALIGDPRVDAVSLTGSVSAGREVAAAAGAQLKRTVLELGGSDPFLVQPSADFAGAVAAAVQSRTQNSGQSCIAAKRFIVHEAIYDRFATALAQAFRVLRVGDPLAPETEIGPLAHRRGLETLERQVAAAVKSGAEILAGGHRLERDGFYFEPTVLSGLAADASVAREEFFGPVALLFRAANLNEAIALANDTSFGLAAAIWTRDPAESGRAITELEAGQVFVNAVVASSPELPFGGIKNSGYGRELGTTGLREFVNAKSVRSDES